MSTVDVRAFLIRVAWSGLLWIILTGGRTEDWMLGVLVVMASAYASLRILLPSVFLLSPVGMIRFIAVFLAYSFRGGIDVAIRASRRFPDIEPGFVHYTTVLPFGASRTFFVAVIGLLPGSLTARLEDDRLQVHLLNRHADVTPQLRSLEERIADMFRDIIDQAEV
ncbi:MAG: cation transporter [Gemmatimonas sp.]|nr:cation transporter [Gemmatimonas sp.]